MLEGKTTPQAHLEASFIAANDVVNKAVALSLERRHVAVTVRVLLNLPHTQGSG